VILKEADAGNTGRASLDTRAGAFQSDAAEPEDGDTLLTSLSERIESDAWRLPLAEYWSEDNEVSTVARRLPDVFCCVTGNCDEQLVVNLSYVSDRNIIRPQMDSVCTNSLGDIGAGVDQQFSFFRIGADGIQRFASEDFQIAARKIFLSQLDVIDVAARCLADLRQQLTSPARLIARKLRPIADVVEKQPAEIFS